MGRIPVIQNLLPPYSDFSSNLAHFILKILENMKILANIQKILFNSRDFWGYHLPEFRTGGHVPRITSPRGVAHAEKVK